MESESSSSGGTFSCPESPATTPSDEAWSRKTLLVFLTRLMLYEEDTGWRPISFVTVEEDSLAIEYDLQDYFLDY